MTTANASIDGRPGGLRHVGRSGLRAIFGTRDGRVGSALIAIVVAVALVGPALAPESPERTGVGPPSQGPSSAHPLGTDGRGSDVLSRVLSGGRRTVVLPLIATAVAFLVGGMIGITLGYLGGRPDLFGARVIDVLLGLPPLLVVLVILAGFGAGSGVVVIAVSLVFAPRIARILRGATQGVSTQDYVKAAQARGESTRGIVLWEVAPNITPTMLVEFALRLTYAIIFIASLELPRTRGAAADGRLGADGGREPGHHHRQSLGHRRPGDTDRPALGRGQLRRGRRDPVPRRRGRARGAGAMSADICIRNGTALVGPELEPVALGELRISADRIVSIGDIGDEPGTIVDAGGGYVLPGLVDAHVHLSLDGALDPFGVEVPGMFLRLPR